MNGQEQAFRSLTLLVAVCEQALVELEMSAVALADDLMPKIEAAHDAAVKAALALGKTPALP